MNIEAPFVETRAKQFNLARLCSNFTLILLVLTGGIMLVLGIYRVIIFPEAQHYVYLAEAILHGRFNVAKPPDGWSDFVYMPDGRIYVPLGPLPVLLTLPGILIWGTGFNGGLLSYVLTLVNIPLLWRLLAQLGIQEFDRRIRLVALFLTGTVYFSIMNGGSSWFQAHILTVTLMLAAIVETLGPRRAFIIGLLLGGLILTRITAFAALPFFVIMLFEGSWRQWIRQMVLMGVAISGSVLVMLAYNYVRFGSPFESGYNLAQLHEPVLYAARDVGLFSLAHVPKNLYAMFLLGPQAYPSIDAPVLQFPYIAPSYWGMGLFWSTPAFIAAFFAPRSSKLVRACWIACICVAIPLCLYYGIGKAQNGYRYALDFLPFLYINAVLVLNNRWGSGSRWLIYASIISSLWAALFFPALSIFKSV